jgi:hypothetical protein
MTPSAPASGINVNPIARQPPPLLHCGPTARARIGSVVDAGGLARLEGPALGGVVVLGGAVPVEMVGARLRMRPRRTDCDQ